MNKKYSLAVAFDWDNTLVDTQDNICNAIKYTINLMGYSNKPINYRNANESRKDYMINLFGNQWQQANQIYQQYLDNAILQNITLNHGVEEMLYTLKERNIYLAIVSNKKNIHLRKEVIYFQLESYFKKVVGSCDTLEDKPSPIPLLFALANSTLHINRENVFFVGDSITDILCARSANCLPIIYRQTISGYADVLCFQHFSQLTYFIVKYLDHRESIS
ncbi:HAD family hydrolase [Wolbachia endosymbiont of Howardula sp.]|uniref:HAD family hydrolase n=1 Tax=Wolbachia endosymbiont of Howardula sp. TaxID=2916816 RepID=UPI00217EF249|nr:HAD family hydrolase [Wolbachia endosymbiont of Howardula sp.]UWI83261.1 HAD family hydrolase [Wolbachia endosymbiont of Howardula sp.]